VRRSTLTAGSALLAIGLCGFGAVGARAATPEVLLTNAQAATPLCPDLAAGCSPTRVVTASLTVTRPPSLQGCGVIDLAIVFSGADPKTGNQSPTEVGVSFTGTTQMSAHLPYVLGQTTKLVQIDASATCEDDPDSSLAADSEFVTLPSFSSVALPSTPQPDPRPTEPVTAGLHDAFVTASLDDIRGAVGACELARLRPADSTLRVICREFALAAAGASDALHPDMSPTRSVLLATGFKPQAFRSAAPGGLCLVRRCHRLDRATAAYLRDLDETGWLYGALARSLRRPSSTSPNVAGIRHLALNTYRTRLAQLAAAQRGKVRRLARLLNRQENLALTIPDWRRALHALRRDRLIAPEILRSNPPLRHRIRALLATGQLGQQQAPTLVQVLRDTGGLAPPVTLPRNRAPQATATLLAAWLGGTAALLRGSCGASYEAAIRKLAAGVTGHQTVTSAASYGRVLAALVLRRMRPAAGPGCTPHAMAVVAPLPDWLSAAPAQLIPSVAIAPTSAVTPQDLAVAPDGSLLVADEGAGRVLRYSAQGQLLGAIGAAGSGPGQLTEPVGVAVDPAGNVYVSDFGADAIDEFSANGSFLRAWGASGSDPGQFDHPAGIAWNEPTQQLDVVDAANDRLEAFSAVGQLAWSTSPDPDSPAYLTRARGIAIAPDGAIAVAEADLNAPRVVLFGPNGTYLAATSDTLRYDPYADPTGFIQPYDVAYDSAGNLWVADRGGTVTELSAGLAPEQVFDSFTPAGAALSPSAIAFMVSGVWLLDADGEQILEFPFSPAGAAPTSSASGSTR
jgi:DNA-binding beta-propeller fold protein YncE